MVRRGDSQGFTLVEAAIAGAVIVAILAVSIPWMRERERKRLQVIAFSEPSKVIAFRAKPAKDSFTYGEPIVIHCELENLTRFPLTPPNRARLEEMFAYFRSNQVSLSTIDLADYELDGTEPSLKPAERIEFDVRFDPIALAAAEIKSSRRGSDYWVIKGYVSSPDRASVFFDYGDLKLSPVSPKGQLDADGEGFQRRSFQLDIRMAGDNELLPDFSKVVVIHIDGIAY